MTSISDYVCNLIAGNKQISTLYFTIDRARNIVNKDNRCQQFQKRITFAGIGSKSYKSSQLLCLEDKALSNPMNKLLAEVDTVPTLDQYIVLLIKARNTIRGLYQSCCRANNLRQYGKQFTYVYVNKFGSAAGVTSNKLRFCDASHFLKFFCECEGNTFNPKLVFAGLEII